MDGLAWQAAFVSGLAEIDQEHQALLAMLQQLRSAIAAGATFSQVKSQLLACASETQRHFQHEETLMAAANHPLYLSHRAAHQNLLRDLSGVLEEVQEHPTKLTPETIEAIGNLVLRHIREEDLPMLYLLTHPEELARQQAAELTAENVF
ncbi:hemerythrin family protein [Thermosynechococcus sichuanensis E542]|uniref:Hemerythrin family protein n=1 Tax=Thermosynechococcus sichuanensis E542 TaxID=2016101 RepID=A0A3B7MGM2_9CYAN|nr:hemerythrin family protein [Thermosynechococcus vestitus]AXY68604.1 hemerythrin family protein [Thermosynechococcus vestitus E542]